MNEQGWRTEPPRPDEWDDGSGGSWWWWRVDGVAWGLRISSSGSIAGAGSSGDMFDDNLSIYSEAVIEGGGEWCRMQGPPP